MSEEAKPTKKNWFVRHKFLTVILVIVILLIAAGASSEDKKTDSASNSGASSTDKKADSKQAKIGEAARDGKFEFIVSGVECGKVSAGSSQYLTKTPQGQYCFLSLSVKNIGDEAQSLFSTNQKLLNAQDQEFAADDVATIYAAPSGSSWYSDINPGNSVQGVIVFDLPKGQTPTVAELHDSSLSGGIKVSL